MYAVIRTGGKQYKVAPQDVLQIEKIDGGAGDAVQFQEVLMISGEGEPHIGSPAIAGAVVSAEVVEQGRGPKVIIFKKRRRQNYRRKRGHRQELTTVRILEILADGQAAAKPAKQAEAPQAGPAPAPAGAREKETAVQPAKAKKVDAVPAADAPAKAEAAPEAASKVKKTKAAEQKAAGGPEAKAETPKKPRAKKAE